MDEEMDAVFAAAERVSKARKVADHDMATEGDEDELRAALLDLKQATQTLEAALAGK